MSVTIIQGEALERTGVILLARILGAGGVPITQASLQTLTYEVGYTDTPPELRKPTQALAQDFVPIRTSASAKSITISASVFDVLQTGPTWLVVAAAPAVNAATVLYVDPLKGQLPAGTVLDFGTSTATLVSVAAKGARQLSVVVAGTITLGSKAVAGTPQTPPASHWKVDDIGYNFRLELSAEELAAIPVEQWPDPRYYVVSVEATPASGAGEVFGWEYRIETSHRLYGKWSAA